MGASKRNLRRGCKRGERVKANWGCNGRDWLKGIWGRVSWRGVVKRNGRDWLKEIGDGVMEGIG